MLRGANLPTLGDFNQRLVLDVIRRHPEGIGRVAVGAATGLTPQTVSNIVRRLGEAGLVAEGERVRTPRGKPPTLLHIEPTRHVAVGIHIDPAQVSALSMDLAGVVHRVASAPTPPEVTPATAVAMVQQLTRRGARGLVRRRRRGRRARHRGRRPGPDRPRARQPAPPAPAARLGRRTVPRHPARGAGLAGAAGQGRDRRGHRRALGAGRTTGRLRVRLPGLRDGGRRRARRPGASRHHQQRRARSWGCSTGPRCRSPWSPGRPRPVCCRAHRRPTPRCGRRSRTLCALADRDPRAAGLLDDAVDPLARGVATLVNVLDVGRVVLGGPSWPLGRRPLARATAPPVGRSTRRPVLGGRRRQPVGRPRLGVRGGRLGPAPFPEPGPALPTG